MYLVCRNLERGEAAKQEITTASGNEVKVMSHDHTGLFLFIIFVCVSLTES